MATAHRIYPCGPHPLHAILLGGSVPLFLGALLSDWAYSSSYHIQWNNFASWLLAGGLVFAGLAILCGVIALFRADGRHRHAVLSLLLLVATWILGFIDALVHAKDAWASMPTGLILSIVVTLLAAVAAWLGLGYHRAGDDV